MQPTSSSWHLTALATAVVMALAACGKEEPKSAPATKAAEPAKPAEPPSMTVKIGSAGQEHHD